ncbi:MAG: PAS domain S-box protein [Bacteroidota bacterium]
MPRKKQQVPDETVELRKQLTETEETLDAIRQYLVDAFVIRKADGEQVVTLTDANFPYRMMVESMNEGAITLIPDGTIFYCNPCFANMIHMETDKLIGTRFRDLIPPEEQTAFDDLFGRAEQLSMRGEFRLRAARAGWVPVQLSIYRLTTENVSGIAILATDITERIHAEKKIRSLATELISVEQEERHRISQILHDDLQQRLFAIRTHLTLLKEENGLAALHPERNLNIDQIQDWLSESINITRNLSVNLSPAVLQGDGLAEAVHWLAAQMKEQYGLQVEVEAETGNDFIDIEEHMRVLLFQAVRELLFNIVKHAETPDATVRLTQENSNGWIAVIDPGRGFDAEVVIRNPQLAHGLLIIKDRLGLMGCTMEINSRPGDGTRVTIKVPLEKAAGA